jgi:hypothetical protein
MSNFTPDEIPERRAVRRRRLRRRSSLWPECSRRQSPGVDFMKLVRSKFTGKKLKGSNISLYISVFEAFCQLKNLNF